MANTRDLTAQFREMSKKYRGPGQISLSRLAALKERLGATARTPPTNANRGETAMPGISATPSNNTASGYRTWERNTAVPQTSRTRAGRYRWIPSRSWS